MLGIQISETSMRMWYCHRTSLFVGEEIPINKVRALPLSIPISILIIN